MASGAIELKKMQVELARVQVGKMELELKVAERMEDIQRLEEHIKLSAAKEAELLKAIEDLK
jgi:hypothetical protein